MMGMDRVLTKSGRMRFSKKLNLQSTIATMDSRVELAACYTNGAASTLGSRMSYVVSVIRISENLRSAAAVCRMFNLKESWLNKMMISDEVGRPDPRRKRMLHGLAHCAHVSVDWILTGEGEPPDDLKKQCKAATVHSPANNLRAL
jgi:hypothetical protein